MTDFDNNSSERRRTMQLDEEQIMEIATRAAAMAVDQISEDIVKVVHERLEQQFYAGIGKSIISKSFALIGAGSFFLVSIFYKDIFEFFGAFLMKVSKK